MNIAEGTRSATRRDAFARELVRAGQYRAATDAYIIAAAEGFTQPAMLNNLGAALTAEGRVREAVAVFRAALSVNPELQTVRSNLLMTLNSLEECSPEALLEEHRMFGSRCGEREHTFHRNVRDRKRRLRIGYVSNCFREHSVARFIEPVPRAHNRENFHVVYYSNYSDSDAVTHRIRDSVDDWREINGLDDRAVAAIVLDDRIDILVDLDGHSSGNRLSLFARKPAPVQVSWLGYPNTTGLTAVDYRLTDSVADPSGPADSHHTERLVRIDPIFLAWPHAGYAPDVEPLPALANGFVTFGCFNQLHKLSGGTVAAIGAVLESVPESRLLLKSAALADGEVCRFHRRRFEERGIDAARILCRGFLADASDHMRLYNSVDIGLDTFPYNGTTTTCEALSMGVPVVTFAGGRHASRVGASILNAAGLPSLAGANADEYIDIAVRLASDLPALAATRQGLRARLASSPLMDGKAFVERLESAYRTMWETWCDSSQDRAVSG